jgi:UDP-glucuronate 4-epimerase
MHARTLRAVGEAREPWTVLVTGATGRVAFPIARALAARGDVVYGMARCRHDGDEARLRDAGVSPIVADVATCDLAALPGGITHVFHAAAALGREARPDDWEHVLDVNALTSGRLLAACTSARAFVLCSTGSAYAYQGARPLREDDPPGVHLGVYSLSKIAAEAVVRFAALDHGVPTTIIRIFSTYGPLGGAPADRLERLLAGRPIRLHPDAPNRYNPVYEDDYARLGIRALEAASTPPLVVNWAGSETVSAEDYLAYLGELVGIAPVIQYDPRAPWPLWPDVTKMHEVLGRCEVPWQDGMRRMLDARHPGARLR